MEVKTYQIINSDSYITIRLSGVCDAFNVKPFQAALIPYLKDPWPHVIFNCENVDTLSIDWARAFLTIQTNLKAQNKAMRLVQVNADTKKLFKENGLDLSFKIMTNLREALSDLGLVTKRMLDTEFVNPFLTATLHVLKVQAQIEANAGKIYLKKPEDKFVGDISGIIGIVSESFNGSVIISFPAPTFLKVMGGMLGEVYTEINQDIMDGAGEITNMIFGQAKIVLNEKGYGIKTALPSVVTGKDHSLSTATKGPVVVVPFTSSAGDFFVEICLSP